MKSAIFVLILCAALSLAQPPDKRIAPTSERRLALVIGNQDYSVGRLTHTIQDAETVAAALPQAGFLPANITLLRNLRDAELRNATRQFAAQVRNGDLVFIYYSGHGVEIRGSNYLLPINLPADATEEWAEDEAVSAQKLLESLDRAGARVRVLALDACRDNPLHPKNKSLKSGLGSMEGAGALVLFATSAGSTAKDNGIFARQLAAALPRPGVSLDDALKSVAREVIRLTNRAQIPAIYGLLEEDVVLVAASAPVTVRPEISSGPVAGQVKEKDGQRFVWIPAGKFLMGCSPGDKECDGDESPAHEVQIAKGFWLGQTSVTVGQWKRYRTAAGKAALPGKDNEGRKLNEDAGDDNLPAVAMTWDEAKGYCESYGGRLPTEAEWEYAARAGSTAARYGDLDAIAWYGDNSGKQRIDSLDIWTKDQANYAKRLFENGNGPHPVGRKEPNAWNLYDMLGNVWQWTADWYDEKYYNRKESVNPAGPPSGTKRALRGGSWSDFPGGVRVSSRYGRVPGVRSVSFGARCVGN